MKRLTDMAEKKKHILRLHWKLFFPLVGLLWLIIGISICYFVAHEKQRQKENLENRLLNVNNTVIDAYERGVDLQSTVDFIRFFTDKTTLAPLRITVYDSNGDMVADNSAETIRLYDDNGNPNSKLMRLIDNTGNATIQDMVVDHDKSMISCKMSKDGSIFSFAALPYEGEVLDFLSIDPMVWFMVIALGVLSSVVAFFGVSAVCRNVYALRDYARAIASDSMPDNIDSINFSKDELGEVSRNLITLYRDKIHAEQEKIHHEHQIGLNISHELNTPIGIIKGYIETVLNDSEMPEDIKRRFLTRAKENTDRLATLVNDVGTVMRLQLENGESINVVPINFRNLVSRIAEDVIQGHIADNMALVFDIPDDCIVMGHESLLTNALLNLIYNAARHSGGSLITIKWLGLRNNMHVFTFSDNGIGVDPEHLGRLFDLFYRVDPGRARKNGGSGLGLPIVRRIFTAIGGNITVASGQPSGLVFTFSLPAATQSDEHPSNDQE